nr:SIS domain-containing protein [Phytohabitans suffuscus]
MNGGHNGRYRPRARRDAVPRRAEEGHRPGRRRPGDRGHRHPGPGARPARLGLHLRQRGSASTASHFVTDFNKGIGAGFRLVCLNDNVPTVLAVANDIGYDQVFVHQLHSLLDPTDLVVAISGSGNSPNVLEAVRYASSRGVETVALVGFDGGRLRDLADHCIHVPVPDMQKVEDVHLAMNHLMMTVLKDHLESRDR